LGTDDLLKASFLLHLINLKEESQPIKQRKYRLSKAKDDILKEELS